ncbi:MAG: ABC transporter ATP-binding protein [Bacteroidales bacterium]|nr:ABC transporter ATP-binding protein [Bacteroidales bacterium]
MAPILQVDSLSKSYGSVLALNQLNLTVSKGDVIGILGPNGSGKTTFLSLILGIKSANGGTFSWFGSTNNKLANNRIGALLEIPYFYPYLSIEKNLRISAMARGYGETDIPQILQKFNLYEKRKSPCYTLSLGMKQRLAIAQTLLGNPEVLVLDEPTNGLDPEGVNEVRNLIKDQSLLGKTVIIASHNLDEIQKICSHVVILKNGVNISHGKVDDLLNFSQVAIIETPQTHELDALLQSTPGCKVLERNIAGVIVSLRSETNIAELNTSLANNGITLNRFEVRRPTLEELFLSIVKNN